MYGLAHHNLHWTHLWSHYGSQPFSAHHVGPQGSTLSSTCSSPPSAHATQLSSPPSVPSVNPAHHQLWPRLTLPRQKILLVCAAQCRRLPRLSRSTGSLSAAMHPVSKQVSAFLLFLLFGKGAPASPPLPLTSFSPALIPLHLSDRTPSPPHTPFSSAPLYPFVAAHPSSLVSPIPPLPCQCPLSLPQTRSPSS